MSHALQDGDAVGKNALLLPGEGGQALGRSAEPLPPRGTAARQHGPDPNLPAIIRGSKRRGQELLTARMQKCQCQHTLSREGESGEHGTCVELVGSVVQPKEVVYHGGFADAPRSQE